MYDLLALYAPTSHSGFWDQLGEEMVQAYQNENFEEINAFGQCSTHSGDEQQPTPRLVFTLDFNKDPVRSVILEVTAAIEPLNELTFNKCVLGGETLQCSAPLYYGGVIRRAMSQNAPKESYHKRHLRESRIGPRGTFHGPRLSVYSTEYSGVPVKNMSTFCTTRTVYHQDRIRLTVSRDNRKHVVELEDDWEWKDAADVFNTVHGANVFTVEMLKLDYASTMMAVKGELVTAKPERSTKLSAMIRALRESNGHTALAMRKGMVCSGERQEDTITQRRPLGELLNKTSRVRKRSSVQRSRDTADVLTGKRENVKGMSHFAAFFEKMNFTQFIRMSLDQYEVYGEEFVSRYAEMLYRIETLCASTVSMLDDFKAPGTFKLDEPKQNTLSVRPTSSTWVPKNDYEFFAKENPAMQHVAFHTGKPDRASLIHCTDILDVSLDENGQVFNVCPHLVGECDRHENWVHRNLDVQKTEKCSVYTMYQ